MQLRALTSAVASFAALLLATVVAASASGTARFQQADGTVSSYPVTIAFVHSSVRITATDGHDTLIFPHAACQPAGLLERCLPYKIILKRPTGTHVIAFDHGAVYLNLTSDTQTLPHSARPIPPNGVELIVRTHRGTFITVRGTLDEVTR